jgi:hypothetical protein
VRRQPSPHCAVCDMVGFKGEGYRKGDKGTEVNGGRE